MASKNLFQSSIEKLRIEILSGKLSFGSLLPSEKELADSLKLSRPTIAKVYNALQNEGLVKKKAGSGTTVVYNKDKKNFSFGLLFPGSGESEIFRTISDQFLLLEKEKDFNCLWEGTIANNVEMRQEAVLKICHYYFESKVDGVFFAPLERTNKANRLNETVCKFFHSKNIPLILLDRDINSFPHNSRYDIISLDNFHGGYVMAEHLISAGCKKIYFFHRKDSASSVYHRLAGCLTACFDAGIPFNNENIIDAEPSDFDVVRKIKIISKKTGIVCANDSTAAVLMSTFHELGAKVSVDFLIVGFDDMEYAKNLHVPLTSYRQPLMDIVRVSHEMMMSRISNPLKGRVNTILSGKLIVRESSKFL